MYANRPITINKKARKFDIEKLVKEALTPEEWKKHLTCDLMKFWNMDTAKELQGGLFPTYRTNKGEVLSENQEKWPEEFIEAAKDPETRGLIDTDHNYVRAHSRQTYAYGIAFYMTGKKEYLQLCRKGALALIDAFDGNYGMYTTQNKVTKEWGPAREKRISQDLAYGLTGLGMYYFLTHDPGVLHKIIQFKDYIFNFYFDEGKGYFTWYPKSVNDRDVEIVAQLDQLYAYMLMLTPCLPKLYKEEWKKDLKKIADTLIGRFYSERYEFFWGTGSTALNESLGTDHTDFGHSVKTFWVILKIGQLLEEPYYIDFARPKINTILKDAYIKETGSWARRFDKDGNREDDKEWWILAELDQACEILSLNDPSYLEYLNNTQRYWLKYMVDHEYGEIWYMVSALDNKPVIKYPKVHSWKTSLHSFEHCLFSYMTAAKIKNVDFELYYAYPEWETVSYKNTAPYMFKGNVTNVMKSQTQLDFMPDGNSIYCVTFDSLH